MPTGGLSVKKETISSKKQDPGHHVDNKLSPRTIHKEWFYWATNQSSTWLYLLSSLTDDGTLVFKWNCQWILLSLLWAAMVLEFHSFLLKANKLIRFITRFRVNHSVPNPDETSFLWCRSPQCATISVFKDCFCPLIWFSFLSCGTFRFLGGEREYAPRNK